MDQIAIPTPKQNETNEEEQRPSKTGSSIHDKGGTIPTEREAQEERGSDFDDHGIEDSEGENAFNGIEEAEPDFSRGRYVHPLWILYHGQLLWASADISYHTQKRELFRWLLQGLLDRLAQVSAFEGCNDERRLLALKGFFSSIRKPAKGTGWQKHLVKLDIQYEDDKKIAITDLLEIIKEDPEFEKYDDRELIAMLHEKKQENRVGWQDHLDSVGILCESGRKLSLGALLAKTGTMKGRKSKDGKDKVENAEGDGNTRETSLPAAMVSLWLERAIIEPLKDVENKSWRDKPRKTVMTLWKALKQDRGHDSDPKSQGDEESFLYNYDEFCGEINRCCAPLVKNARAIGFEFKEFRATKKSLENFSKFDVVKDAFRRDQHER